MIMKAIGQIACAVCKSLGGEVEKVTPQLKPFGIIDINEMSSILLNKIEEMGDSKVELYLADVQSKVYNKDTLKAFLGLDETESIKYQPELFDCDIPEEIAYGLGLFYSDGSCGLRDGKKAGASWRIVGWKLDCLEKIKSAFEKQWSDLIFSINLYDDYTVGSNTNYGTRKKNLYCLDVGIPHPTHKGHQKALGGQYGKRGEFIEQFRNTIYDGNDKKVPSEILKSSPVVKRAFLLGVIDGDGTVSKEHPTTGTISCHGIKQVNELKSLMLDIGWKVNKIRKDKGNDNYAIPYNSRGRQLIASLSFPACDDFAAELYGRGVPLLWTNTHALNWFVDTENVLWFIEPQTDKIARTLENWQGWDIRFFLNR